MATLEMKVAMHAMSASTRILSLTTYLGSRDLVITGLQTALTNAILILIFLGVLYLFIDTMLNRAIYNRNYSCRAQNRYKLSDLPAETETLLYTANETMGTHSGSRTNIQTRAVPPNNM